MTYLSQAFTKRDNALAHEAAVSFDGRWAGYTTRHGPSQCGGKWLCEGLALIYQEVQPLGLGVRVFTALIALAETLFFGYGAFNQIRNGHPFGTNPLPNVPLAALTIGLAFAGWTAAAAMCAARVIVEVEPEAIAVRLSPIQRRARKFPLIGLVACCATDDVRAARRGARVYAVADRGGVELTYESGNRVMIGSKMPERLAAAIRAAAGLQP